MPPKNRIPVEGQMALFSEGVTYGELARWLMSEPGISKHRKLKILNAVQRLIEESRQRSEASKNEAIQLLAKNLNDKMRMEIERRDEVLRKAVGYYEGITSDLLGKDDRDSKTGLLTAEAFFARLDVKLRNERRAAWASLGWLDIHKFKQVNDPPGPGHLIGDRVIKQVAEIMQETIRSGDPFDLIARVGGDEFAFFVINHDPYAALLVGKRFTEAVRAYPWSDIHPFFEYHPVRVDLGVATVSMAELKRLREEEIKRVRQNLRTKADELMYYCKQSEGSPASGFFIADPEGGLMELDW